MVNMKDVMVVLIGNDRTHDYKINLELMRYNYSYGLDLWITTVYNGDLNDLSSGIGENTFIYLPENRGYGYGALDGFNKGLDFARAGYRPYVAIFNFDVWFLNERGFAQAITDFVDSGKEFSAGFHETHKWAMTDCMFFRKDFLNQILPIQDKVLESRKQNKWLQNEMQGTELGFENMEEWFLYSLKSNLTGKDDYGETNTQEDLELIVEDIQNVWHHLERDGHPRYRFTDKYKLIHEHDWEIRKKYLIDYNQTQGHNISRLLGKEIKHTKIENMRTSGGETISV